MEASPIVPGLCEPYTRTVSRDGRGAKNSHLHSGLCTAQSCDYVLRYVPYSQGFGSWALENIPARRATLQAFLPLLYRTALARLSHGQVWFPTTGRALRQAPCPNARDLITSASRRASLRSSMPQISEFYFPGFSAGRWLPDKASGPSSPPVVTKIFQESVLAFPRFQHPRLQRPCKHSRKLPSIEPRYHLMREDKEDPSCCYLSLVSERRATSWGPPKIGSH